MNLTSQFDTFLYSPIDEESAGMRLTVISVLARMNLDPWEEAARLTRLPTSDAENSLFETLLLFPGDQSKAPKMELLAARLVALLPKKLAETAATQAPDAEGRLLLFKYWLALLCLEIVLTFFVPYQHAPTAGAPDPVMNSKMAPSTEVKGTSLPASDSASQADLRDAPLATVAPANLPAP